MVKIFGLGKDRRRAPAHEEQQEDHRSLTTSRPHDLQEVSCSHEEWTGRGKRNYPESRTFHKVLLILYDAEMSN
ncbi:hypothetical protein EYF80_059823 [Liparis tanakae]|uniref:Uncharacterized protein n=1 Tax=Liparis tanakae TaxID=230148 RepID=A0A4Z2EMB0_9TELE|nr:hypothetical protein EYF80_059823 [Liparis tanakae]